MKLDFNTYRSKVRGCYLGKTIGGTLGAPFECYRGVYDVDGFMQDVSEPVPNDDVDLQLVWLAAAEREGKNIDSHVLAEYWTTYVSAAFSEYGTGKNNFRMGILPPLSGHMRNENRNSNGAWIRTEIWACLCAGNPALAATYAYYDACVDHSGEGVYAAVFMAAVQAAAFFESDVHKLIAIGLSYIPAACGVRSAVELVLSCRRKGDTWKQARKKLLCTLPSSFGEMMGMRIAAGNLFFGQFDAVNAVSAPRAATLFGIPFNSVPKTFTGYYMFKPGETMTDADGAVISGRVDQPDFYVVMYENSIIVDGKRQSVMLDGNNVLTHENIVGLARIQNPKVWTDEQIEAGEWERFEIPFVFMPGKQIDEDKLANYGYNIAIVLSSSIDGAYFVGAVGSTLYIDTLEIICEE